MEANKFRMRYSLASWFILMLMLNLHTGVLFADTPHLLFERLMVEDGLSQGFIKCILQDRRGFLWLGTEGGLSRYDGYNFKTYNHEYQNKDSLSNSMVEALLEDHLGNLWVGTQYGLNRFDRVKESFVAYVNDSLNPNTLNNNHILCLYEDKQGIIWIGTNGGGLNRFDAKTGKFSHFLPAECANETVMTIRPPHCVINCIFQDSKGAMWLGTACGFYHFNPQTGAFTLIHLGAKKSHGENPGIQAITPGQSGILWLGTTAGLVQFRMAERSFEYYIKTDKKTALNCNDVSAICVGSYDCNVLWVGTIGGGLNRFNVRLKTFEHFLKSPGKPSSLSNNKISFLYKDRSGILWIGTESGLNKLDERKSKFSHWTVEPGSEQGIKNEYVWAIYKDKQGLIWLGTNEGFSSINRQTGEIKNYLPPNIETSDQRVSAIYGDMLGYIWIGTRGSGVYRFDPRTGHFLSFRHQENNPASLSGDAIRDIFVDSFGIVWIGTEKDGLNRFVTATGTFIHYNWKLDVPGSLSCESVSCIYQDATRVLWVGTTDGLNRLNPDRKTFTVYKYNPLNDNGLSLNNVSDIVVDRFGTLWVGTYGGGLNRLSDPERGIFTHYRKGKDENTLSSDMVYGVLEDEYGNLWLSTDKGLTYLDTNSGRCRHYDMRDGLQSYEFIGHARFKARGDHEMLFGGINGFNAFDPAQIKDNTFAPPIVITNIFVFNEPFLKQSASETKAITFDHQQSVFSIEFAALDFSIPSKNQYSYKMEGVDPQWVFCDANKRFAGYTQLAAGEYRFRVKGSNNHGVWGQETSLKIKITPPFWERWWFRLGLGVFVLLVIFAAHLMRIRLLRQKLKEQKRVQEILTESHEQMVRARDLAEFRHAENEKLLTAISAIFIAVDSERLIFQWNQPAVDFFVISKEEALHCPFETLMQPYMKPETLTDILHKGLASECPTNDLEITIDFRSRGMGLKLLFANVCPILDRTGKKLGFLLMAEDITNRKEEEIVYNLSKKLEALGQMASGIAHEIKTPLQYIAHNARFVGDSFADIVAMCNFIKESLPLIEQAGSPELVEKIKQKMKEYDLEYILEEVPKATEQIINGVTKVSGIIQTMSEYTYPGRGFMEKWNINELIKSALLEVQHAIKGKSELQLDLAEFLPPVPCYPDQLVQVFFSVLENAVDAIEETGKMGLIRIATTLENEQVVISVADNGIGIPEENRENIFHPFFTTKLTGRGTGQGLSISRHVVTEKHKGKLEFTSKVGEGTTFFIRLPLEKEGEH